CIMQCIRVAYITPLASQSLVLCFFFFKQKTAYEIFTCLEFRRVLFRSGGKQLLTLTRRHIHDQDAVDASLDSRLRKALIAHDLRSEERRVGKECRSQGRPAREKKTRQRKPLRTLQPSRKKER